MYKIFWVDMAKATGNKLIGKRPVVSTEANGNILTVYEITSRNKNDRFHAHMNNYLIRGYCDCGIRYEVDKKYVRNYIRDCTLTEYREISAKINALSNKKTAV